MSQDLHLTDRVLKLRRVTSGLRSVLAKKLSPDDPMGVWIKDFMESDDPRFDGKSKAQRRKMAMGAYFAAQRK